MPQAKTNVTDGAEPKYPPNPLVCTTSPHGTLTNCRDIAEFLGMRLACWNSSGIDFGDDDGNAVFLILQCVGDALKWEAERVQYERKTEAEVAGEQARMEGLRAAAKGRAEVRHG